jgi:hypothetical protein
MIIYSVGQALITNMLTVQLYPFTKVTFYIFSFLLFSKESLHFYCRYELINAKGMLWRPRSEANKAKERN